MNYDLVVLGCGPGGYKAALKGAKNRLKTALVEQAELGGVCLNRGCVPTKLFLGSTSVLSRLKSQKKLRLAEGDIHFDLGGLQARKRSIIKASQKAMQSSLEQFGVDIYAGAGRLAGGTTIRVKDEQLNCNHLILATGSRSGFFPGLEPDHKNILTSTDALELTSVPESMTVIGSGPVGLEIGQIFHRLGTGIVLIEAMSRIVPLEDEQVSTDISRYLKREGWDVRTGVKAEKLSVKDKQVEIHLDNGSNLETEKCLLAMGRLPNTGDMNLDSCNIRVYGPGWIKTNQYLMACDDIFAIGDVNGRSMYAHSADHQAEYVVDHILGRTHAPYDHKPAPSCIFGSMEVIRTGLGQKDLAAEGAVFRVSSSGLAANPIVQGYGLVQGFIKVFWRDDRVVGITGVGHGLSGLVTLAQVITDQGWTRKDAEQYIFAHPTLDESLQQALLAQQQQIADDGLLIDQPVQRPAAIIP